MNSDNYSLPFNRISSKEALSRLQSGTMRQGTIKRGIVGGTFDPPHLGHLVMAEAARTQLGLKEVIFMPAAQPPHKQGVAISSLTHRFAMVRHAIADHEQFTLSTFEATREGLNYTTETMRLLRQEWGNQVELFFILGLDSLIDLPKWYQPQQLIQLVNLAVIARPGYDANMDALERRLPGITKRLVFAHAPLIGISSTDIRKRVQQGLSIRYLVPRSVETYIEQWGLYRG